jgi:FAD/FMN-containing dehydrogenase
VHAAHPPALEGGEGARDLNAREAMTMNPELLDHLRRIVGASHVLTAPEHDLQGWEQDWRKRTRGRALAVVRPGRTDEVAAVVKACAAAGVSIVPQGGNTGLVVGGVPDESGTQVLLSLTRLNAVRAIDGQNLTLTVEAGCVLQAVQEAAREAGFLFPLSLAAEGSCTIGGNLATNAGGTQVLRYGNARELCLGLEVVTAQGQVWDGLAGLRKDNTGYDLRDLFIGSEGTLGIITAATMKLHPLPAARLTAWLAVDGVDAASRLLALAHRQLAAGLIGFELMNQFALSLVDKHFAHLRTPLWREHPWCVLIDFFSNDEPAAAQAVFERFLELALESGAAQDAVIAQSMADTQRLWQVRESIPLAQAEEGLNIKHDISIPISRIADFVAYTDALLQDAIPGVRLVDFGHMGDGNLHYNVQAPEGADGKAFLREQEARVNTLVYDAVMRFGGSISAEHGVGSLKADCLPHYKSAVALEMMRSIKRALDPDNRLNPGRVLAA